MNKHLNSTSKSVTCPFLLGIQILSLRPSNIPISGSLDDNSEESRIPVLDGEKREDDDGVRLDPEMKNKRTDLSVHNFEI